MKVAIYTRVSTDEQANEGTSLEVQKEYLIEFAKRQKWDIHYNDGEVYTDEMTGYSLNRPSLKKLLEDAKLKKFESILVYKIDRFSRSLQNLLNLVDELDGFDVALQSATEPFDTTTSAGKLMFQQLGSFAEFERNRIKERVFPGMKKGVEKYGNWQGARFAPFGYRYVKEEKLLVPVPEEVEIVKLIYQMYLAKKSTAQIAGLLNRQGVKTRCGGKFHDKLCRDILRNKIYLGIIQWNKYSYDKKQKTRRGYKYVKNHPSKIVTGQGRHEPIISQDIFLKVQKRLDSNRKGCAHRETNQEYPLSGIMYCGECGYKIRGAYVTSNHANNARKRYYRCNSRYRLDSDCSGPSVRAEVIEPQVYAILETLMTNPEIIDYRKSEFVKQATLAKNEDLETEKRTAQGKLRDNIEKQKQLTRLHLDKVISYDALKDECIDLRLEEQNLKKVLAKIDMQLVEKERSEAYRRVLKRTLSEFDRTQKKFDILAQKELLQLIFKSVILKGKNIDKFELYEPFKRLYEDSINCLNQTKTTTSKEANSATSRHTAAR